jgi:transmembrane sensor
LLYSKWKYIYRVAAAAAVLLIGVYVAQMLLSTQHPVPDLAQNPTSTTQELTQEQTGQSVRIFYLPDGTKVDLMPGSTLRQAPDFGQTQRLVYLEGTARFDVAKDKKRPFIVDARGMRTTALGTIFMVSSGGKGQKASVALMEGRVKVEYRKQGDDVGQIVALDPGQQVMLEPEREAFSPVFPLEAALTATWEKQQVLAFEKIRLEQVFRQLEASYNVRFEGIPPALANYQVSGDFDTRLPLSEILEALAFSNDFKYVIHDKSTIQIYSN